MPGNWITSQQVKLYMESRIQNNTQKSSIAKSSILERAGREIEKGRRENPRTSVRHWRTRNVVWKCVPYLSQAKKPQAFRGCR